MELISPKDCSFCIRPDGESDIPGRTIYETDNFRVFPTMRQITDGGYVLIAPKAHFPCIGAFTPALMDEFVAVKDELEKRITAKYQSPEFFEHGVIGQTVQHAHLHIIPADAKGKQLDFYRRDRFEELPLDSIKDLSKIWNNRGVYIFSEVKSNPLAFVTQAVPMYVRNIYAEILGVPERANWRTMDRTLDDRLIAETIAKLKS